MPLVDSLLTAVVRSDGDALVLHVGEKPYVVAASGSVELSRQGLGLGAMEGMLAQLLRPTPFAASRETGRRGARTRGNPAGGADRSPWWRPRRRRHLDRTAPSPPGAAGSPAVSQAGGRSPARTVTDYDPGGRTRRRSRRRPRRARMSLRAGRRCRPGAPVPAAGAARRGAHVTGRRIRRRRLRPSAPRRAAVEDARGRARGRRSLMRRPSSLMPDFERRDTSPRRGPWPVPGSISSAGGRAGPRRRRSRSRPTSRSWLPHPRPQADLVAGAVRRWTAPAPATAGSPTSNPDRGRPVDEVAVPGHRRRVLHVTPAAAYRPRLSATSPACRWLGSPPAPAVSPRSPRYDAPAAADSPRAPMPPVEPTVPDHPPTGPSNRSRRCPDCPPAYESTAATRREARPKPLPGVVLSLTRDSARRRRPVVARSRPRRRHRAPAAPGGGARRLGALPDHPGASRGARRRRHPPRSRAKRRCRAATSKPRCSNWRPKARATRKAPSGFATCRTSAGSASRRSATTAAPARCCG